MNSSRIYILLILALVGVAIVGSAYRAGKRMAYIQRLDDHYAIRYDRAVYENPAVLGECLQRALEDDLSAMCLTATAGYIYRDDTLARDTLPIVPVEMAATALYLSASRGYEHAQTLIRTLYYFGLWNDDLPAPLDEEPLFRRDSLIRRYHLSALISPRPWAYPADLNTLTITYEE